MMVLDAAAELRSDASYPEGLMMSALTHDFGKAVSTLVEEHKVSAIGHEKTGIALARQFLRRISNENKMERYVLNMAELHMKPNMLAGDRAGRKSTSKLFDQSESGSFRQRQRRGLQRNGSLPSGTSFVLQGTHVAALCTGAGSGGSGHKTRSRFQRSAGIFP